MEAADANVIVLPVKSSHGNTRTTSSRATFARRFQPVLNEGLADFYSTFRGDYRGGQTLTGAVPSYRMLTLRSNTFEAAERHRVVEGSGRSGAGKSRSACSTPNLGARALHHDRAPERGAESARNVTEGAREVGQSGRGFREAFGTTSTAWTRTAAVQSRGVAETPAPTMQTDKQKAEEARPISEADMNALEGRSAAAGRRLRRCRTGS